MEYIERNFDNYTPEGIFYRRSLVHMFLNNKPIVIEAKSINELNEKVKETKEFLDKEWAKVKLKNKYQQLTDERLNLLKNSLKETQLLKWNEVQLPLKVFSTNIIKYNQLFYPIGYYNCGQDGEKFNIHGNNRSYFEVEPIEPEEKNFLKLWHKLFKDNKKIDDLNKEYNTDMKEYHENINRYRRLIFEQKQWTERDHETINIRLKKYYIAHPKLIEKEAYNLLEKSRFHHKQLAYKSQYYNYNINEKKLSLIYLLPEKENIKNFLIEPNYESLQWSDVSEKEEKERIDSIFHQLILIAISEQFVADKLKLIGFIFIKAYSREWNSAKGICEWQEFKELELSRKEFEGLNLEMLDPCRCIAHYTEEYKDKINNRDKNNGNDKLNKHLSSIKSAIEDIPYNIDIEPTVNTNIETLNNSDGGIVNFKT